MYFVEKEKIITKLLKLEYINQYSLIAVILPHNYYVNNNIIHVNVIILAMLSIQIQF